eukprot:4118030-Prymnesium_polylepis.1
MSPKRGEKHGTSPKAGAGSAAGAVREDDDDDDDEIRGKHSGAWLPITSMLLMVTLAADESCELLVTKLGVEKKLLGWCSTATSSGFMF